MNTRKLSNIPLRDYRLFLQKIGCVLEGTSGGHEKWSKPGLTRPIIVQTHITPVPERIVQNALRALGLTKEDFFNIMQK